MSKGGTGSANLNYELTLKEAELRFVEKDLTRLAILTGATLNTEGVLELMFLGEKFLVTSQGEVEKSAGADEVGLTVKILILHYLATAAGVPVQHKLISFKELPGGAIYIGPFTNRAIRPLVNVFGNNPGELLRVGQSLGAEQAGLGDVSIELKVFPHVPITLVLWGGDDEFPPSGNILFDISAPNYLPTEDYAVLASMVVFKLKNLLADAN